MAPKSLASRRDSWHCQRRCCVLISCSCKKNLALLQHLKALAAVAWASELVVSAPHDSHIVARELWRNHNGPSHRDKLATIIGLFNCVSPWRWNSGFSIHIGFKLHMSL